MIDQFLSEVRARLRVGEREYGNKSFERPSVSLIMELQQEALDLAGWGYVLWQKLETMRAKAAEVDDGN